MKLLTASLFIGSPLAAILTLVGCSNRVDPALSNMTNVVSVVVDTNGPIVATVKYGWTPQGAGTTWTGKEGKFHYSFDCVEFCAKVEFKNQGSKAERLPTGIKLGLASAFDKAIKLDLALKDLKSDKFFRLSDGLSIEPGSTECFYVRSICKYDDLLTDTPTLYFDYAEADIINWFNQRIIKGTRGASAPHVALSKLPDHEAFFQPAGCAHMLIANLTSLHVDTVSPTDLLSPATGGEKVRMKIPIANIRFVLGVTNRSDADWIFGGPVVVVDTATNFVADLIYGSSQGFDMEWTSTNVPAHARIELPFTASLPNIELARATNWCLYSEHHNFLIPVTNLSRTNGPSGGR